MNFLAEVLSSADEFNIEKLNKNVPEITSAVENLKETVSTFVDSIYVNFSERPKRGKLLIKESSKLCMDVLSMKETLKEVVSKELIKTANDVDNYSSSLEKVSVSLSFIGIILKVNEGIINIREHQKNKDYLQAAKECKQVEDLICSVPEDEKLTVIDKMEIILCTEKTVLRSKLTEIFKDNVILMTDEESKSFSMKIRKDNNEWIEATQVLYDIEEYVSCLDDVTKFMWQYVFIPIVDYSTKVDIIEDGDFNVLNIRVLDESTKMPYKEVFSKIKASLNFFKSYFHFELAGDKTATSYIGQDIRDNISELIIKNCLHFTIPSTNDGLEKYNIVMEDIKQLEMALMDAHIFTEDTYSISDYANNIDILFINKKCQEYLKTAQLIMKKDLHEVEEVGSPFDPNNPLKNKDKFSKCCISKSILELLKLVTNILQEIIKSSDVSAGRLLCTVQNIFQMYVTFVPEFHKKLLQTIPQQVALYFNNCLFMAHEIVKFNEEYSQKIASKLSIQLPIFDDGHTLKIIATETFSNYVKGQVKQIEDIMKETGLQNTPTLEKLDSKVEKCIRQCLRQQELLKTVWGKVLPYETYNNTMGSIFDSLCKSLIFEVVKFEDISSAASGQLVDVLKIVVSRGPKLFIDPKEVSLYSKCWYRLNELVFVLSSSLLDINDRWADGKGPLALEFKPTELKSLIRALFQNTDYRASLLAKIV